jgi:hypothetical protein
LSQGALGGTAMGTATSSASISMTENGELVLKGLIHILQCPTDIRTGTTSVENEEQLVIKVVGANGEGTVATRSPQLGGPRTYIHNDSIVVNVDQINTTLGGEDDDFIQLKVNRVGNTCEAPLALLPGEVTLARLDVSIPRATVEVSPTTATLEPGATATFTATTENTTSA